MDVDMAVGESVRYDSRDYRFVKLSGSPEAVERRLAIEKRVMRIEQELAELLTSSASRDAAAGTADVKPAVPAEASESEKQLCLQLGHLNLLLEDFPKALSAYQRYVLVAKEYRTNVELLYGLGHVYFYFEAFRLSAESFRLCLYVQPTFLRANEAHLRLAFICWFFGELEQSTKHFKQVLVDSSPCSQSKAETKLQLAQLYESAGRYRLAKDLFESLVNGSNETDGVTDAVRASALRHLGWLVHQGHVALSALTVTTTSGSNNANSSSNANNATKDNAGQSEAQRRSVRAIELLQRSLELDGQSGIGWYTLGRVQAALGRVHDAFVAYRHSIDKAEDSADTWCSIGVLYAQQHQLMDALQAYVCAVQLDRRHLPAWTDLALLYESCVQYHDALACYQHALDAAQSRVRKCGDVHKGQEDDENDDLNDHEPVQLESERDPSAVERISERAAAIRAQLARVPTVVLDSRARKIPSIDEACSLPIPTELTNRQQAARSAACSAANQSNCSQAQQPAVLSGLGYAFARNAQPSQSNDSHGAFPPQQLNNMHMLQANAAGLSAAQRQSLSTMQQQQQQFSSFSKAGQFFPGQPLDNTSAQLANEQSSASAAASQQASSLLGNLVEPQLPSDLQSLQPSASLGLMDAHTDIAELLKHDQDVTAGFPEDLFVQLVQTNNLLDEAPPIATSSAGTSQSQNTATAASSARAAITNASSARERSSANGEHSSTRNALEQNRKRPQSQNSCTTSDPFRSGELDITMSAKQILLRSRNLVNEENMYSVPLSVSLLPDADLDLLRDQSGNEGQSNKPGAKSPSEESQGDESDLSPAVPSIVLENKRDATSAELVRFCYAHPVVLIRGLAGALKLDLSLFSTRTLVEANPEHRIEVRTQKQQAPDENSDNVGRPVWRCESARSHCTIAKYAQYQAANFQETLREEQERGSEKPAASALNASSSGAISGTAGKANSAKVARTDKDCKTPAGRQKQKDKKRDGTDTATGSNSSADSACRMIKFGTNCDLSDGQKWRPQLDELQKLPPFLRLVSAANMLSHVGYTILGMNSVQLYMKVPGCRTPGHQENLNFCSVNINIGPGDCEWFACSKQHWWAVKKHCEKNKVDFLAGSWWPNVAELQAEGVPVYRFVQKPGDLVWVNVGAVHWVQALGWCNNVAWNVGPLTATQYKGSLERYEFNRLNNLQSIVPLTLLSWQLARHVHSTDAELLAVLKKTLALSLRQSQMVADFLEILHVEPRFYGRSNQEQAFYCNECDAEVFNFLFVSEQTGKLIVHCADCARKIDSRLVGFVVLYQFTMKELAEIYDGCQLHTPPSSTTASAANAGTNSNSNSNSVVIANNATVNSNANVNANNTATTTSLSPNNATKMVASAPVAQLAQASIAK